MEYRNAGLLLRVFAYLLDVLLLMLLAMVPAFILLITLDTFNSVSIVSGLINVGTYLIIAFFLFGLVISFYFIYFTSRFGGTLGKRLFGLRVLGQDTGLYIDVKTSLYRYFVGYTFSSLFLFLGFFRIIWNENKLGWHDELFDSKVVRAGSMIPGFVAILVLLGISTLMVYFSTTTLIEVVFDQINNISAL